MNFYKILGDTDTATEASQLLAKLTRSEQDVTRWTRIAAGVSGTFGDSLPIEGLIEATNETAKTAKVTGVLADALNWVGISEDDFNKRLERCSGEAERNKLLMDTLTTAYEGAADAFYRNNEELVRARANTAAVSAVTAKLGSAAQTAKGWIWQLLGAQEDGSLRAGSALDWLSQRADGLMQKFQQWSQDGTVTRLAQQFDQGLAKGIRHGQRRLPVGGGQRGHHPAGAHRRGERPGGGEDSEIRVRHHHGGADGPEVHLRGQHLSGREPHLFGHYGGHCGGRTADRQLGQGKGHGHRPVGGSQAGVRRHPGQRDRGL